MADWKLIIEDDDGAMTAVPLMRDLITIGRKEGNTIRLTARNISRFHARLERVQGSLVLEDLSSYNGIKVNGGRIQGRVSVREGDLIEIGDYHLALQAEMAAQPASPPESTAPGLAAHFPGLSEGDDAFSGDTQRWEPPPPQDPSTIEGGFSLSHLPQGRDLEETARVVMGPPGGAAGPAGAPPLVGAGSSASPGLGAPPLRSLLALGGVEADEALAPPAVAAPLPAKTEPYMPRFDLDALGDAAGRPALDRVQPAVATDIAPVASSAPPAPASAPLSGLPPAVGEVSAGVLSAEATPVVNPLPSVTELGRAPISQEPTLSAPSQPPTAAAGVPAALQSGVTPQAGAAAASFLPPSASIQAPGGQVPVEPAVPRAVTIVEVPLVAAPAASGPLALATSPAGLPRPTGTHAVEARAASSGAALAAPTAELPPSAPPAASGVVARAASAPAPSVHEEETEAVVVARGHDPSLHEPRLVVLSTQFAGTVYPLRADELVVGRTEANDLVIQHKSVSRSHCKLVRRGTSVRVVDLKSANGTLVNGEEQDDVELRSGDVIELGRVHLRFVAPGESFALSPAEIERAREADAQGDEWQDESTLTSLSMGVLAQPRRMFVLVAVATVVLVGVVLAALVVRSKSRSSDAPAASAQPAPSASGAAAGDAPAPASGE